MKHVLYVDVSNLPYRTLNISLYLILKKYFSFSGQLATCTCSNTYKTYYISYKIRVKFVKYDFKIAKIYHFIPKQKLIFSPKFLIEKYCISPISA